MVKEIGWDDDNVEASGTDLTERRYVLEAGRIDVIRILSPCMVIDRTYIRESGIYITSDENDTTLIDHGYEPKKTYACLVLHIASIKKKKIEKIGLTKVWIFADKSKYVQLREVNEAYGNITKHELRVTCIDSKFQKISSIMVVMNKEKLLMEKSMVADVKENKGLLALLTKSKSPKEIEEILEGVDSNVMDEDDEEVEEEVKLKKKGKKKKVVVDDEDDDVDDDEEEVVQKKKGKKKKVVEEDDSEDADLDAEIEALLD